MKLQPPRSRHASHLDSGRCTTNGARSMLTRQGSAARPGVGSRAALLGRILLAARLPAAAVLPVHALYQHAGTPGPLGGSPAGVSRTAAPNPPQAMPRPAAAVLVG